MDISDTLAPTSDQLDAVDLLSGPRTFIIADVSRGNAEQPVNVTLDGFDRPWRPGKSMRRVLVAAWGADASTYVGRRVTLFCDQNVSFGKDKVGGTRISHLSHIEKRLTVPLLVSRGKSAIYSVEPLPDATGSNSPASEDVAGCTDVAKLRGWWPGANSALRKQIEARVAELTATPDSDDHEADLLALQAESAQ